MYKKIEKEDYKICDNLDQNKKSYIYGEVYYKDIYNIINKYELENKRFIDIGCGNGKIINYLSIKTNLIVDGIEIDKNRYQKSLLLNNYNNCNEIINDTFENLYLGNYDIIYCCNTIFEDEDNNKLINKILNEFNGLLLLFEYNRKICNYLIDIKKVKTSWNKCLSIYIFLIN